MRRSFFKNVLVLAGLIAAASPAAGSATASGKGQILTQQSGTPAKPRIQSEIPKTLSGDSISGQAGRILNQRQYRKMLRQNPHFRNSKKCRI